MTMDQLDDVSVASRKLYRGRRCTREPGKAGRLHTFTVSESIQTEKR
jgi:hypothetical protein